MVIEKPKNQKESPLPSPLFQIGLMQRRGGGWGLDGATLRRQRKTGGGGQDKRRKPQPKISARLGVGTPMGRSPRKGMCGGYRGARKGRKGVCER